MCVGLSASFRAVQLELETCCSLLNLQHGQRCVPSLQAAACCKEPFFSFFFFLSVYVHSVVGFPSWLYVEYFAAILLSPSFVCRLWTVRCVNYILTFSDCVDRLLSVLRGEK